MSAESIGTQDPFAPLRRKVFAVLWGAHVMGHIGTFMREVASSWMVTELSTSPTSVALVQTAATLPIFLLAIPAGVLSDTLDRRRFLIIVQIMLACLSATLLLLSHTNALTVEYLVALTFIGGIGTALMGPALQSIVPELVALADLKNAVTLNQLGTNIARAIGPAVAGLLLASFGAAAVYGADVLCYVTVIAALLWWKRPPTLDTGLSEHFFGAFRAGMRYARASEELRVVLMRVAVFFLFASPVWALLPLVARSMLSGSAGFYGVMLGAVGAGAILYAVLHPYVRARLDSDQLVLTASLISAGVMLSLAAAPPRWVAVLLMLLLGVGWIIALITLNGVAQAVLPNWVRGRGLAIYLTVVNGALAAGSLAWGLIAQEIGVPTTLIVGAAGLAIVAFVFHRVKLPSGDADLQASYHWPAPMLSAPFDNDRGPVMVQIEYRVRPQDQPAFLDALQRLAQERRRDGAYAWGITEHSSEPERLMEWFLVESWAEHLRQHHRVSHADAIVQNEVNGFHIGPGKPVVNHFLGLGMKHARETAQRSRSSKHMPHQH